MEYTQRRLFLVRLATSESSILNAWNSLVDMLMRVEIGFVQGLQKCYEETSSSKSITTTILPGKSGILVETCGLSERELHRLSQVRKDLSVALWQIFQSYWRDKNHESVRHYFTLQSMEQAVKWEECKQRVKPIEKEMSLEQDWLIKMPMKQELKQPELKLEAEISMSRHSLIKELKTYLRLMEQQ